MNTCLCPYCNQAIIVRLHKTRSSQSWEVNQGYVFNSAGPWSEEMSGQGQGAIEATRTTPARAATLESDVLVPLAQSLATGLAVAVPSIGLTIWLEWSWYAPLAIGGFTTTITWLQLLGAHRKLLWIVETVSNLVDSPEPETTSPKPKPISLEVKHEEAGRINRMQFIDLPQGVTQDQFTDWALAISNGIKSPARSNWAGSGKPFSRDTYDLLIKAMVQAGILANWPGKGYQVTNGGKHALKSAIRT